MPPNVNQRFTRRLRDFLRKNNLDQRHLAKIFKIDASATSKLLNGKRKKGYTLNEAWAMARAHAKKTGHPGEITLAWYFDQIGL